MAKITYQYAPQNVCSKLMLIELDDETHVISDCKIMGGCPGNLLGISKIVVGMKAEDVIAKFKGNPCGQRPTSCPDQLATALEQMLSK